MASELGRLRRAAQRDGCDGLSATLALRRAVGVGRQRRVGVQRRHAHLIQAREPLSLNRWRVYDPRVGQYLQPEPMLMLGSTSTSPPWAYVSLSPGNWVDPLGRYGEEVAIGFCVLNPEICIILGIIVIGIGICNSQDGPIPIPWTDARTDFGEPESDWNNCEYIGSPPHISVGTAQSCNYNCDEGSLNVYCTSGCDASSIEDLWLDRDCIFSGGHDWTPTGS